MTDKSDMIYYRRRNSNEPLPPRRESRHPLLTYCNWSHHISRHIDEDTLRDMLTNVQERYFHFYLRMINETPRNVVDDFIEQNNLPQDILENIYQELDRRGFDLRELEEKERSKKKTEIPIRKVEYTYEELKAVHDNPNQLTEEELKNTFIEDDEKVDISKLKI